MKEYKILLVDDEPWIINEFESEFQEYSIKTFIRPELALKAIQEEQFHILFLDIYMPRINGITLCREIRNSTLNRDSYVIAHTSEEDHERQLLIFQEDFDDFIEKPMRVDMIKAKINALLKKDLKKENSRFNQLIEMNHTYYLNGNKIKLTPTEFKIIKLLSSKQLDYYSSANIELLLKDNDVNVSISTSRVHIKNIRNKFYEIDPNNEYVKTVPQKGYKLIDLEIFSINSNKVKNVTTFEIPETKHKKVIETMQQQELSIVDKFIKFTKPGFLKGLKYKNSKQNEVERQIYSFNLDKDLFSRFENIAKEKNIDISIIIEEFMSNYSNVNTISKNC